MVALHSLLRLTICLAFLLVSSCEQPKQVIKQQYEITFTFGVIGYVYDCDTYVKTGNTYRLYVDNKLTKTFDVGANILVEIEKVNEQ